MRPALTPPRGPREVYSPKATRPPRRHASQHRFLPGVRAHGAMSRRAGLMIFRSQENRDVRPSREEVKEVVGASLEPFRNSCGNRWSKRFPRRDESNPVRKEVKDMCEERAERRRQVAAIKAEARSANDGRSYLLQGLWACRLASGCTQRQLAQMIGSNQATVRELEAGHRGAYPATIRRLSEALDVAPADLISGGNAQR